MSIYIEKQEYSDIIYLNNNNNDNPDLTIEELVQTRLFKAYGTVNSPKITNKANQSIFNRVEGEVLCLYSTDAYQLINSYLRGQEEIFAEEVSNADSVIEDEETITFLKKSKVETPIRLNRDETLELYRKDCSKITSVFKAALSHLPSSIVTVYRGDLLSDQELKLMKSKQYIDKAPMSCSLQYIIAKSFLYRSSYNDLEQHKAFITLKLTSGKNISAFSMSEDEEEVLVPPDTLFDVESITETTESEFLEQAENKSTIYLVTLKEIEKKG